MLEGGGRTPLLSPAELEGLGYKIVAYPLSLLGVSIRAMQGALASLKVQSPCLPQPDCMALLLGLQYGKLSFFPCACILVGALWGVLWTGP